MKMIRNNSVISKACLLAGFAFCMLLSGCAGHSLRDEVSVLALRRRYADAARALEQSKAGYGQSDRLLYLLDKGLVNHYAKEYEQSLAAFADAKQAYDQLYTRSLTRLAGSALINDNTLSYRGEDFERVMINIFQALNYAALGRLNEALVEARDVDSVLSSINAQYQPGQKNVYREDAFARLLMALVYGSQPGTQAVNDAYISWRKAAEIYEQDYRMNYGTTMPDLVKQDLLTFARRFGCKEGKYWQDRFPDIDVFPWEERQGLAEVVLVYYQGPSPRKRESAVIFPLPDGYLARVSFPRYLKRTFYAPVPDLQAKSTQGEEVSVPLELGEDIAAIAARDLEDRKVRFIAKSAARSAGKYALVRTQKENIKNKYGRSEAELFGLGMNVLIAWSEQADTRSWATLPARIHIGRLRLPPGEYQIFFDGKILDAAADLAAGETYFYIAH